MKKLFGFMLLIAFCAIMSPVVTANEPPGREQTVYSACTNNLMNIFPVYTVDPAVFFIQDLFAVSPVSYIVIPANFYFSYPEVCGRTGPMNSISITLSTIAIEQIIYNNKSGITYMEMGYSIWS
jgi:hypothetical protein